MIFVSSWDTGLVGATWDSGLQWDVNVGPSLGDVTPYVNLVTSEHRDQPNFIGTLTALVGPLADIQVLLGSMPATRDIDEAVGTQLDDLGLWVGITRNLAVPLEDVYFELDSATLGLDQGSMQGPTDPTSALVSLPDPDYRTLLRARIVRNQWDGSVPNAYEIWDTAFAGTGHGFFIQDNGDMSMNVALTGVVPDAITLALFTNGLLSPRPSGVRIALYLTPADDNVPYFGLDIETSSVSGLDVGAFGYETIGA